MTYLERLASDPDLRAFLDGQIAQTCGVELAALRAEHDRLTAVVGAQARQIGDFKADAKKRGRRATD